jgi:1,4-alpha-glucan branching enzyme
MSFVKSEEYTIEQRENLSGRFVLQSFSQMLHHAAFEIIISTKSSTDISQKQTLSYLKNIYFQYELHIQYKGDMTKQWITTHDPYNFHLILSDQSLQLFGSQYYWYSAQLMGSHTLVLNGVNGVRFSVWAPQAKSVSVIGDWNDWDFVAHPMRLRFPFGVWEIFVPHLSPSHKYNYSILKNDLTRCTKIDPYAREFENPPATCSIISKDDDDASTNSFQWTDAVWIKTRESLGLQDKIQELPMAIYEMHLPSWMRGDDNRYLGYQELAHRIVSHVKKLNFTHVEFLPITHHPFEGSWGYQTTGYYAVYSRLGSPSDLKFLINELHNNGIGVFLDLALGHFARVRFFFYSTSKVI